MHFREAQNRDVRGEPLFLGLVIEGNGEYTSHVVLFEICCLVNPVWLDMLENFSCGGICYAGMQ